MMPSSRPCTSPLRRMVTSRAAKPQAASVPIAYSAVVIPASSGRDRARGVRRWHRRRRPSADGCRAAILFRRLVMAAPPPVGGHHLPTTLGEGHRRVDRARARLWTVGLDARRLWTGRRGQALIRIRALICGSSMKVCPGAIFSGLPSASVNWKTLLTAPLLQVPLDVAAAVEVVEGALGVDDVVDRLHLAPARVDLRVVLTSADDHDVVRRHALAVGQHMRPPRHAAQVLAASWRRSCSPCRRCRPSSTAHGRSAPACRSQC